MITNIKERHKNVDFKRNLVHATIKTLHCYSWTSVFGMQAMLSSTDILIFHFAEQTKITNSTETSSTPGTTKITQPLSEETMITAPDTADKERNLLRQ